MTSSTVTSIRIKTDIWKEAKKRATELDMHVSDFVETSLIHEIQRGKR